MRSRASTFGVSLVVICILTGLPGIVNACPSLGSVISHQKISDLEGNFTEPLVNADEFGGAVVGLGDLDGPGPSVAALAVGAIGEDDGGGNRGGVYVLFLGATGTVLSYQKISATAGGFTPITPLDGLDDFGSSVASLGDLDQAGASVAAMAVGAAGDDDGGTDQGCVYVLFLNSAGSVLSNQKISETAGNFTGVLDPADEFGGAVAGLEDLDGPGPSVGALAVGVIGDDDGGLSRGAVYILFLNSAGSVLSHTKLNSTSLPGQLASADEFGSSVAYLGDLDGPGPSAGALAVGAIGDDDGGPDRGCVYILFLDTTGNVLTFQKISATLGGFTGTLDDLDEFGGALVGLGDLDTYGPSKAALAVGTIGDDDGGSGFGATYVLFLNSAGTVMSHQKLSALSGNFTGSLSPGDEFGGALANLGDLDGIGPAAGALVSGASFDDDGGSDRGAVYVLFLEGVTLTDAAEQLPGAPINVLGRARPNPFNPSTSIPFRIGETAWVEIHIWDVQGRLVRKLVQGRTSPGQHEAAWDGLDDSGRPLASGSYVYRMSVNGQAATAAEKAVLLK